MSNTSVERRIVMARLLARQWIISRAKPEYRTTIYCCGKDWKNLPNLLRSFRDSKVRIGSIDSISDLGIAEGFDAVTVWSSDRENLVRLASWFESQGYDTSGVW